VAGVVWRRASGDRWRVVACGAACQRVAGGAAESRGKQHARVAGRERRKGNRHLVGACRCPGGNDPRTGGNPMNEIFIYDDIGPDWAGMVSAKFITDELKKFAGEPVVIRINSPGG